MARHRAAVANLLLPSVRASRGGGAVDRMRLHFSGGFGDSVVHVMWMRWAVTVMSRVSVELRAGSVGRLGRSWCRQVEVAAGRVLCVAVRRRDVMGVRGWERGGLCAGRCYSWVRAVRWGGACRMRGRVGKWLGQQQGSVRCSH